MGLLCRDKFMAQVLFSVFYKISRCKVYIFIRSNMRTNHSKHIHARCDDMVVQREGKSPDAGVQRTGGLCGRFCSLFSIQGECGEILGTSETQDETFWTEPLEKKSRLIEFGRFAEENRRRKGSGKPETFTFLGFKHYCSRSLNGKFRVKRKTSKKKFTKKCKDVHKKIKSMRTWKLRDYKASTPDTCWFRVWLWQGLQDLSFSLWLGLPMSECQCM